MASMTTARGSLQAELGALLGPDDVRPATVADAIAGVDAQVVVMPQSAEAIAQVLRWATEQGRKVVPQGSGSKQGWGNPPAQVDIVLSLGRLNRVLEHAWGDMTATVQAGCTITEFDRTLAEHGQRLALDPLWPDRATVGGVLSTNDSGALRVRYGSMRDLVIGMTVVLPDGTLARSGGKVVKNVAGYDLPKLMTGALGTLGIITEATFRLYPLPIGVRIVALQLPSVAAATSLLLQVLDSQLVPTGLQLRASATGLPQLIVRFEGVAAAGEQQVRQLRQLAEGVGGQVQSDEPALGAAAAEELWRDAGQAILAKCSVLPGDFGKFLGAVARVSGPLKVHWQVVLQGLGVGWLRLDGPNEQALLVAVALLRTELEQLSGSLVVAQAPLAIQGRLDPWGPVGDTLPLMQRVKQRFDPQGTLNPGRFVGGI